MGHATNHQHHMVKAHHKLHTDPPYVSAFIKRVTGVAKTVKANWGVPISVLIAQGALESAWGTKVKGNAYFGIKGKSPSGASVKVATHEVVGGTSKAETDQFRAYKDLEEAADDYGRFLKTNHRYVTCFAFKDQPDLFVDHLAKAGYASDPNYAHKLKSIIHGHRLAALDKPPGG